MKVVILGIGNILLKDEGVGVRTIEHLRRLPLPPFVEVIDGGTATFDLLPILSEAEHLVVIDAVKGGGEPGTIYRLTPEDLLPSEEAPISVHDLGLLEALRMVEQLGQAPRSVVIFGVEPKEIAWGMELTPEVQGAIPRVIEAVLEEVRKRAKDI